MGAHFWRAGPVSGCPAANWHPKPFYHRSVPTKERACGRGPRTLSPTMLSTESGMSSAFGEPLDASPRWRRGRARPLPLHSHAGEPAPSSSSSCHRAK